MTLFGHERKMQAFDALNNIYEALCAEEMTGAFRASYINKQVETLRDILDKNKKRRTKQYARWKRRLRDFKRH